MWNKEQLEAINTINGNVMAVASAGAGKSSCLVARIENMVKQGIKQEDILAISFTNAAVVELKDKLKSIGLEQVNVGTFHSICRKLLLDNGVTAAANLPNRYMVKREMEKATGEKNLNIDDVLSFIGYQKAYMIGFAEEFEKKESMYDEGTLRTCYRVYEQIKKQKDWMDFDDYLVCTYFMYKEGILNKNWKYLLVDETQDTATVQYELIKLWCPYNNVFATGDVKQSLYSWRGAKPELFQNFYKEFPNTKVINLYTNYRSCKNIVDAANAFIAPYNLSDPNYKDSESFNKEDGVIICNDFEDNQSEAIAVGKRIKKLIDEGESPEDIAIIYRNNAMADCVESELRQRDIPYHIMSDKSFFDKKEIRGITALLRLVVNSNDDEAFEICMSEFRCYPLMYYKKELLDELKTRSGMRDCSLYEAFLDYNFDQAWQGRNRDIFDDMITRLKLQHERHLPTNMVINNIIRMFKIEEGIRDQYESDVWQDKFDSLSNLKTIADGTQIEGFLNLAAAKPKSKKKKDGVVLCSIHKSKGLQWKYVFLIGLEDGKFPSDRSTLDEESRIMYVGVTRATSYQWVSSIGNSQFYKEYCKQ